MPSPSSKEILIGPGGWAYLPFKGNKLQIASRIFDFVEVNNTFYSIPDLQQVSRWKKDVSQKNLGFKFTVRANREITHEGQLKPAEKVFKTYDKMAEICKVLNADVLHFLLPSTHKIQNKEDIEPLKDFFSSVTKPSNTMFALEIRSPNPTPYLYKFMEDNDIVHCVDLTKNEPVYQNKDMTYSRVFGKGFKSIYEFDDKEIKDLAQKARSQKSRRTYIAFHNLKMYEDASRLREYIRMSQHEKKEPVIFVAVTSPAKSLLQLLAREVEFPVTKKGLLRRVGWRTIQRDSERVHVSDVIKNIPDKKYESASEIISASGL
jgi:uncharacterized protein YecE (DUF72 family)